MTPEVVKSTCDRYFGVGSDGILAVVPSSEADFGVRIYNPDGSEAEKSVNGLRILGIHLYVTGRTDTREFTVETPGGIVRASMHIDNMGFVNSTFIEMGRPDFRP